MRIATWNIEWFNALFDAHDRPIVDDVPSARFGVSRAQQTEAVAKVFVALDADAVLVVEAPDRSRRRDTVRALEHFAAVFGLRTRRAVMGFANDTQQEIALLFDPDRLSARHDPQGGDGAPRFDRSFRIDLDIDATADVVRFSKPPLELEVVTAGGLRMRWIGAHLKSKAPHGARGHDQMMRMAIQNRRKQLAQAIWLRARIEAHLDAGEALIVLGDLNDGPGLDAYEGLFGRSSVEIVMGEGEHALLDPHARLALRQRLGVMPTTARFYIEPEKRFLQALLDYIFVSPGLMARRPAWRIWHPFDDPHCWSDPELREALLAASDHFPVTLDLDEGGLTKPAPTDYIRNMTRIALPLLIFLALPAAAQEAESDPRSLMQRGAEMFLEGLRGEMAPALDDLAGLAEQFGPAMRGFIEEMGPAMADILEQVQDWSVYHPPEMLPNGDIIIRRKVTPDAQQDPVPEGQIDL